MDHYEQCQQHVRRLLNRLLREPRFKFPYESNAAKLLESYVEAPAFPPSRRRELIEDAYAVHHLPSPYDIDPWLERRASAGQA